MKEVNNKTKSQSYNSCSYCCSNLSSSNMASSSSVRLASMLPMSLRTSAGSVLCDLALCCLLGVGDGWGGKPVRCLTGE